MSNEEPNLRLPPEEDDYPNAGTLRWVTEVLGSGVMLRLDDGSWWHVAPDNRNAALLWQDNPVVTVRKGKASSHALRAEDGSLVRGRFCGFGVLARSKFQLGRHDG